MTVDPFKKTKEAWEMHNIRREATTNYRCSPEGQSVGNPLTDRSIYGLLLVSLASVLDEGLEAYITQTPLTGKHGRLYDRIELVSQNSSINATALHDFREARNEEAHRAADASLLAERVDWSKLTQYENLVGDSLRLLGIIGPQSKYGWFWVQEAVRGENGKLVQDFKVGVQRDDVEVFVFTYKKTYDL